MTTPPEHDPEQGPDEAEQQKKAAEAYQQMGATPPATEPRPAGSGLEPGPSSDLPAPDPIDQELAGLLAEAAEAPEDLRSKEELLLALTEAEAKAAEAQDDHLRLAAEFANYRRRAERDAMQGRIAGRVDVLSALLDVLDDFDRTVAAAADSPDEGLRSGVTLVHGKLAQALAQHGLTRLDEAGVPFDPNRHEAVQKVDAADGPLEHERVQQVFRPGYLHGDRVLRAAMVVVEQ